MFKRARQSRLIPYDPAELLELPSTTTGRHRAVTPEERAAILAVAEDHRAGLWVLTMFYTGMRSGETAALMWSDTDFAHNEIHVHAAKESGSNSIKSPKTAPGTRDIPIHAALLPKLRAAQGKPFSPVFPTQAGNRYLQGQTGCRIYALGIECAFTCRPILEPSFLYGGYPCRELRHKFLMAQESDARELTRECLPEGFGIVPLPGHFFDMVGFRTPDDVVYLADCLSSRETLDKYQIGFLYDVAAYLDTLERVKSLEAKMFIPAHAPASEDVTALAQYNIDKVLEIADRIADICREPACFETILQKLFAGYGLTMNFEQYVLAGSTVRSYLSWLKDAGRLEGLFQDHMLLWKRI